MPQVKSNVSMCTHEAAIAAIHKLLDRNIHPDFSIDIIGLTQYKIHTDSAYAAAPIAVSVSFLKFALSAPAAMPLICS